MSSPSSKLPSLVSSRISTLEDYRNWQQSRKRAYHAELDRQVTMRIMSRMESQAEKSRQKSNMSALVQEERKQHIKDKYAKIKTEQIYMQDNLQLMRKSNQKSRQSRQWHYEEKEHPFVKLLDQEQARRRQTKHNFICQNQLNALQTNMKRSQKAKNKEQAQTQGRNYVKHVEKQFQKHYQDRVEFENRYLKINRDSPQPFKRQYLEYLKGQADHKISSTRSLQKRVQERESKELQRGNTSAVASLGTAPMAFDRRKQLQTIQKSLNGFEQKSGHKREQRNCINQRIHTRQGRDMSLRKQFDMRISRVLGLEERRATQKSTVLPERQHRMSSQREVLNRSEVLSRMTTNPESSRQFKHYDIIRNVQKMIKC